MKRVIALLLCTLLLSSCAVAQEGAPAEVAAPLEGAAYFPAGATEETARYQFVYRYPQLPAADSIAERVNAYYQGVLRDMLDVLIPQEYAALTLEGIPEGPAYLTSIDYAVRCDNEDYLSVAFTATQFLGNSVAQSVSANVFARQGEYAGALCSLSQVVGMEQEGDELSEAASYASSLAYRLIWQIICEQQAAGQVDYLEGLTREDVERAFSPETDFLLDEDGNLVFFVQAGMIAGEVEGVLYFPFAVAEFLSAARE